MPRPDQLRSALTFRLRRRRYALALDRTCGVRDLTTLRRVPGAPRPWIGLTDWGDGRVLNVLDLPAMVGDRGVEPVESIVRLRAPYDDLALFVPARFGLAECTPPEVLPADAIVPLAGGTDALHWISVDALLPLAAVEIRR